MRVPLPWLREYCDPALDVHQIEERLTMTGTKVEAIHHHGVPSPDGFVVGRVLSAEQAEEYRTWFDNERTLRQLMHELEELSMAVADADPRWPKRR